MRYAPLASMAALSILLVGCQNQPEETPDIEEAIPLDEEDGSEASNEGNAAESDDDDERPPATMESGSNDDPSIYGGENEGAPGPGSKLQPADPVE
ncbi:hypothetical protein NAP1_10718 [Erythrobacter sp. NAP1]|uniref:hypothetical protein n=1 Tax=Erythrobacter sp. NAP1 TaxID=237727 RepID=UPI0000687993|nr:hypothetical protein [Erythrobacter sp. NAP1]EAQ28061.1 hypothetical protein NAP1_10718 [Erythrobacter sp. NAP1]